MIEMPAEVQEEERIINKSYMKKKFSFILIGLLFFITGCTPVPPKMDGTNTTSLNSDSNNYDCINQQEKESFTEPIPIIWLARMDGCLSSCFGGSFTKESSTDQHLRFAGYYPDTSGKYYWDGEGHGAQIPSEFQKDQPLLRIYGDWLGIEDDHPHTVFEDKCVPMIEIKKIELVK